jgi:CRISPR-associated exonuclease Cas4
MLASNADLELTVTDLKQWSYCARIPFYRYVLPVDYVRTYKMQRGKAAQDAVEALERRRRFREYGLLEGKRLFGIFLRSAELGMAGKLDLLIETAAACFPVDFKDTEGGVRQNHRVQIAAYALLAEEAFGKPVPEGFVYLTPTDAVVRVPVSPEDRARVRTFVAEIRAMIADEALPDPTPVRSRCTVCEYRNYCADIW